MTSVILLNFDACNKLRIVSLFHIKEFVEQILHEDDKQKFEIMQNTHSLLLLNSCFKKNCKYPSEKRTFLVVLFFAICSG